MKPTLRGGNPVRVFAELDGFLFGAYESEFEDEKVWIPARWDKRGWYFEDGESNLDLIYAEDAPEGAGTEEPVHQN
jgi:hypothetical protein